jgi:hypothetical protein
MNNQVIRLHVSLAAFAVAGLTASQAHAQVSCNALAGTDSGNDFSTCASVSTSIPVSVASLSASSFSGGSFSGSSFTGGTISGTSSSGTAVEGSSNTGTGVEGVSTNQTGVFGISSSSTNCGVYGQNNSTGFGVAGRISPAGQGYAIYGDNNSTVFGALAGYFHGNIEVTGIPYAQQSTFTVLSDVRLKKNVQPLTGALDRLLQLHGVTYEWKDPAEHANQTGTQHGFIAQEVEKVMPEWVTTDDKGFKSISIPGRGLDAMTVESIRSLKFENDLLNGRVRALESSRRSLVSGVGEGGIGVGMLALAGALVVTRRRRSDVSP